ncbi:hypothetical protein D3C75_1096150 [compost metagenome]
MQITLCGYPQRPFDRAFVPYPGTVSSQLVQLLIQLHEQDGTLCIELIASRHGP